MLRYRRPTEGVRSRQLGTASIADNEEALVVGYQSCVGGQLNCKRRIRITLIEQAHDPRVITENCHLGGSPSAATLTVRPDLFRVAEEEERLTEMPDSNDVASHSERPIERCADSRWLGETWSPTVAGCSRVVDPAGDRAAVFQHDTSVGLQNNERARLVAVVVGHGDSVARNDVVDSAVLGGVEAERVDGRGTDRGEVAIADLVVFGQVDDVLELVEVDLTGGEGRVGSGRTIRGRRMEEL